ncbi:hypothetical protein SAMN06297397_0944 [Aristaeella lactis]|uniref:Uncharacterized protein n=1 Tax=Aristaeella lactis TaxID=3046383 RepID=A0AC61PJF8_9FIRM|nr:hypothetical protein SAMN06297397_0944 [Aristaeella lactis]
MLNVPPLNPGMMLVSWLDLFAKVNCYDSFLSFRKEYLTRNGLVNRKISLARTALFPTLYGRDAAIDYALDMLCSEQSDMNIRRIIYGNTLFPAFTAFYSKPQQAQFKAITDFDLPIDRDTITEEYNQFCHFQGIDNILCTKCDFINRIKSQNGSELRYCPHCMNDDINAFGAPVAHLFHNFPYVYICPIHNEELVVFPDGITEQGNDYRVANPHIPPENLQYASFVYDLIKYVQEENRPIDLTSFTYSVYQMQKALRVSSWRILCSIIHEGYIDSDFLGLEVRRYPSGITYNYYEDETLNYFLYEPENMICVLLYLVGSFDKFIPFLEDRNYEPPKSFIDDYHQRNDSNYCIKTLNKMTTDELRNVIEEKTNGNCYLSHIDQGKCFVRYNELPPCKQFKKYMLDKNSHRILTLNYEEVVNDLSQNKIYMFLPVKSEDIKYCPPIKKNDQAALFSGYCESVLREIKSKKVTEIDLRRLLPMLPRNSFGLLNQADCHRILMEVIEKHHELECTTGKYPFLRINYNEEVVGA